MANATMVDLDQLIPSLDMIHGLVDQDPSGAKAWLRDVMLMLRVPVEGEALPGAAVREPEDIRSSDLVRDDPLRFHPVVGRTRFYDEPARPLPFVPNRSTGKKSKKNKKHKPKPNPTPALQNLGRPGRDYSQTRLPVGKLKGATFAEIVERGDRQYLEWFERQPWTPPWLKSDLRKFLASCSGNGSRAKILA